MALIDLVVDQKVQPEHVVRGLAEAPTIDPAAVAQLIALPGLSDGEAEQQRDEYGQKRGVRVMACVESDHPVGHRLCRCTTPWTRFSASTTTIEVILRVSRIWRASAASVSAGRSPDAGS
jgi:hypothetical protein